MDEESCDIESECLESPVLCKSVHSRVATVNNQVSFTMDDYRPQSPDLSGFSSYNPEPPSLYPQTQAFPTSFPQPANYGAPLSAVSNHPQQLYPTSNMPRNRRMKAEMSVDDDEWAPSERAPKAGGRKGKKQKIEEDCGKSAPGVEEGIEVKTKFPVARIKRIMQADEDVGKVAQVTPTAVCEFVHSSQS